MCPIFRGSFVVVICIDIGLMKMYSTIPSPQNDRVSECLIFMTGLVGLVQHQSIPYLPLQASEVLLSLHRPENIELWDQKDPMTAFWDISGQVCTIVW